MRSTLRRLPALADATSVALLLLACLPCLTAATAANAQAAYMNPGVSVADANTEFSSLSETDSQDSREKRERDGYAAGFALGVGLALADRAAQTEFSAGHRGSVTVTGRTRNPETGGTGHFRDWSAGRTGRSGFSGVSTPAPNPEPGEWVAMGMMGGSVLGLMARAKRRRSVRPR